MNAKLARYITDAADRYWVEGVQILSARQDGPADVCVVYRRTIDPLMTLGDLPTFKPPVKVLRKLADT